MIRQFRPGLWIDPDQVHSVTCVGFDRYQVNVGTSTGPLQFLLGERDDAVALADEIGTAARIAQEARLAADTRFHRETPGLCPHREAADPEQPYCHGSIPTPIVPAKTIWPADDAGRPE